MVILLGGLVPSVRDWAWTCLLGQTISLWNPYLSVTIIRLCHWASVIVIKSTKEPHLTLHHLSLSEVQIPVLNLHTQKTESVATQVVIVEFKCMIEIRPFECKPSAFSWSAVLDCVRSAQCSLLHVITVTRFCLLSKSY